MTDQDAPLIILLGGASGVGKTTLANALVQELGLAHHASTGFLREAVRSVLPEAQARVLKGHAFDAWRLMDGAAPTDHRALQGALAQARILQPAFQACIARSLREGVSLVLEGSHILPGVADSAPGVSLFCVLDVPDRDLLMHRARGNTHRRRILDEGQAASILELQEECLHLARTNRVPVVDSTDLDHAMAQVRVLLSERR